MSQEPLLLHNRLDSTAACALRVQAALRTSHPQWAEHPPEPLPDKGLAHWHVRLPGSGLLARVPKQSQMNLPAAENLAYQAACFARAAPSGHVPRLHAVLAPSVQLPRGALLVEEIIGQNACLPHDLPALVQALAAIHALPLPPEAERAPLLNPADPMAALLHEIGQQAQHLDAAQLTAASRAGIDAVWAQLKVACARRTQPWPRRLITFDAHPGNFLLRADGSAVLVDLEKARYGVAALDLAHATLVTSTTWGFDSSFALNPAQVLDAYRWWQQALGFERTGDPRDWWLARSAMWLWSVTWCAKWRACAAQASRSSSDGEDWSIEHSDQHLALHVRGRVDAYLSPIGIGSVRAELAALAQAWGLE